MQSERRESERKSVRGKREETGFTECEIETGVDIDGKHHVVGRGTVLFPQQLLHGTSQTIEGEGKELEDGEDDGRDI